MEAMLRLVFQTGVFGPLRFEYNQRRVRVGSCRDNDLVLPHPSVHPYHCTLALEEDWLAVLGPHAPEETPIEGVPILGPGDKLNVGDLVLDIERSPNSVGVPVARPEGAPAGRTAEGYWMVGWYGIPDAARWLCGTCSLRFEDEQVRSIGLAGRRRHVLCPVCSQHVAFVRPGPAAPSTFGGKIQHWGRKLLRIFGF